MNPLSALGDAWYFYRRHCLAISGLCLPLIVLEALIRQVLNSTLNTDQAAIGDLLLSLLCYPLYGAALILFIDNRLHAQQASHAALYAGALRLWPRMAVLCALATLLIMLGASLLILPGLWLMVRLAFAEYLLVLHGLPPLAALRESFLLTRGYFWQLGPLLLGIILPLWLLHGWLGSLLPSPSSPLAVLLDSGHALAQLFTSVLAWRLCQLRLQLTEAA